MSRAVTVAALRARIRGAGDFGPDTTSGRYPNSRLLTEMNASWQRAREIITTRGDGQMYLKSVTGTLTPGTVNPASSFGTLDLPTDCLAVHGIDVVFSSVDIRSLEAASFGDRNIFRDVYGGPTGRPIAFAYINSGVETTNTVSAPKVAIFPAPDTGYNYCAWYLPVWVDRVNDTDVFDGIAGHETWALWDCVISIATGDNDAQNVLRMAEAERAKAEAMITTRVNSMQRVGPSRRRDVAGQSRRARQLFWRRPR